MARRDCDAPTTPAPVLSNTDLIDRLSLLRPNLIRFSRFSYSGGAYAVNPFTAPPEPAAYGDQRKAIILPGNDADVEASLLDRDFGAATAGHNGATYSISFYAYLRGGGTSGTFYAGFRDENGDPLTPTTWPADVDPNILDAADDVSFSVTATPTLFTWENVASDDPAFYADLPNNAQFKFFVSGTSDLPSGSELVITLFQMQNGDYYAPFDIDLPWRPARGEEDLAQYTEYVLTTNFLELAAKRRQRVTSNLEGVGLLLETNGPVRVVRVPEDAYTLDEASDGTLIVTTGTDPAVTQEITVPASADVAIRTRSKVQIRQEGDSPFQLIPGLGVTINPPIGGSLRSIGKGSVMELIKRSSSDIWDVTYSSAAAGGLTFIAFEYGEFDTVVPTGRLDSRRAPTDFTVIDVRANVDTAAGAGTLEFDFLVDGVSILSTTLTIDAGEETSEAPGTTPAVIDTPLIIDDAKITLEGIDDADGSALGVRAWLIGYPTNASVTGVPPPVDATYWRVRSNCPETGNGGDLSIAELMFMTSAGAGAQPGTGTALESGHGGGFVAANAYDGNAATYWYAGTGSSTGWLGFQFDASWPITHVSITTRDSGTYYQGPRTFFVEYSDDGSTWTVVGYFVAAPWSGSSTQVFDLSTGYASDDLSALDEVGGYRFWAFKNTGVSYQGGDPSYQVELVLKKSGVAIQTAYHAFTGPVQAFDGVTGDAYFGLANGSNFPIDFGYKRAVDQVGVTMRSSASGIQGMKTYELWAGDTDLNIANMTLITSVNDTGANPPGANATPLFSVP